MNIPDYDNLQMINDNCKNYKRTLIYLGYRQERIYEAKDHTIKSWLNHATWMCEEILQLIDKEPDKGLKINRWYGCLQGLLMMGHIHTLDQCRSHNRTESTTQ